MMASMISHIDHLVLTVRSLTATCEFYERVLGFRRIEEAGRPTALHFGTGKINLHEVEHTFPPKAEKPTPGSGDFCLITDHQLDEVLARLSAEGISVELGPVARTGAKGPMTSIYFRDPDRNLVEVSLYERDRDR